MDLQFDDAWDAYLRAAPLWPDPPADHPTPVPMQVATLADLADLADIFVMDGYGVLNVDRDPVPGMVDMVNMMQAAGKAIYFLSNGASHETARTLDTLTRMGYRLCQSRALSSWDLAWGEFDGQPSGDGPWGAALPDDLAMEKLPRPMVRLTDTASPYEEAGGFLLLSSQDWTAHRQALLVGTLSERARPVVVANPDMVAPYPDSAEIQPGYWGLDLWQRTGIRPVFTGKPFDMAYKAIWRRIRSDLGSSVVPKRVMMVGDTPFTDILGGARAGFRTALMTDHGFFRERNDIAELLRQAGIFPDFLIGRPADFPPVR